MGLSVSCEERLAWRFAIVLLLCQLLLASCSGESISNTPVPKSAERLYGVVNRHTGAIVALGAGFDGLYKQGEEPPPGDWQDMSMGQFFFLESKSGIRGSITNPRMKWKFDRADRSRYLIAADYYTPSVGSNDAKDTLIVVSSTDSKATGTLPPRGPNWSSGLLLLRLPEEFSRIARDFSSKIDDDNMFDTVPPSAEWIWPLYTALAGSGVVFDEARALTSLNQDWWTANGVPEHVGKWLVNNRALSSLRSFSASAEPADRRRYAHLQSRLAVQVWEAIEKSGCPVPVETLRAAVIYLTSSAESSIDSDYRPSQTLIVIVARRCRRDFPNANWWKVEPFLGALATHDLQQNEDFSKPPKTGNGAD